LTKEEQMDPNRNEQEQPDDAQGGTTRRDFVKSAAAVGGSLSVAAFLASCGGSSSSPSPTTTATTTSAQGTPKSGGNFRFGVSGGGTSETLNPTAGVSEADLCRAPMCYEPLVKLGGTGVIEYVLAESLTPNSDFTEWTLKLRPGVKFHDGSALTVDDVIWSARASLLVKPWAAFSAGAFGNIDPNGFKKVSSTELMIKMTSPNSLLPAVLTEPYDFIYQNGVKTFTTPIGTGPWKFVSWTRGERATYERWDEWWGPKPYFDTVETLSISDPTARLNALTAGEVDAIADPSVPQIPSIQSNSSLKFIENPGGLCNVICMSTMTGKSYVTPNMGAAEVQNNQVRQALRYLVPRQQMIESVWAGHAKMGNDLHSWFDPDYDGMLPQRPYDPEKAKSMLKAAGVANLNRSIFIQSDINPGNLSQTTLWASACSQAGFPLPTKTVPQSSYFSSYWPNKYPISIDYWRGRVLGDQWRVSLIPGAPFNETNWLNPQFANIYNEILKTNDATRQKELFYEGQKLLYDEGGYIIPTFANFLQATTSKVMNVQTGITESFNNFDFTKSWFS
jgi:peptide/nickel transport system substrate-binding protein